MSSGAGRSSCDQPPGLVAGGQVAQPASDEAPAVDGHGHVGDAPLDELVRHAELVVGPPAAGARELLAVAQVPPDRADIEPVAHRRVDAAAVHRLARSSSAGSTAVAAMKI